mgnify:CR=1 FL=1
MARAEAGPRIITIERRWAAGGAVATILVIAALAVALIVAGSGEDHSGERDGFGPPGFGQTMAPPGSHTVARSRR